MRSRAAAVLVACVAVCALSAPAAFAADHAVNLTSSDTFSPSAVSVAPGDTVTWHWAGDTHNVTADSGQAITFSSGNKSSGTFVQTFNTAGHFTYRCTLHGGMTGVVNVAAPSGTPDTTPPGAPTSLTATAGDASVTLNWADSTATDLANYVVQRRVGTATWSTVGSPTLSALTDATVTNGTTYSYRVTAVDTTGNVSTASAIVTASPVAPPPPPPGGGPVDHAVNLTSSDTFSPSAVTVAPGDTVTWHWAGTTHNVTADAGQADTFSSGNKSSGTFVKTFNTAGHFTYRCTLHSGMTGAVNVVAPSPTPDTTPPGAPTAVIATAGDARVTVDWADSSAPDLANYVVQRSVGTGAWSTVGSPTLSVLTDTTVTNGTTYSYRVTAVDTTGNVSTASATATASPVAPTPPPPGGGPADHHVAIANYLYGPSTITVNTGDRVIWDWSGSDVNHSVTATAGQSESFDSHLGLTDNQITGAPAAGFSHTFNQVGSFTYYCRVHTNMTGTVRVVTPPATPDTTPPAAPAAAVTTAADSSVTVDWADSSATDLANYVVQRQTGSGAWTTVAQPVASVYVDTSVVNGTTYSYRVSAVDTNGNISVASAIVTATPVAPAVAQSNAGPVVRHVAIAGYAYAPATVTVNSGDTVEWDWTGSDVNHSVTTLGGLLESFDSHLGALVTAIVGPPAGGTYSHVFSQVGSFGYLCRVHPDMTGTVRVVASGAPDVQPADPPAAPKPAAPAPDVKPARAAKTYAVKIADYAFAPANLSIALGDVVKWNWTGTDTNHSVSSTAGQAESYESHSGLKISEILKAPAGGSFSHSFTHEGTFTYFCRVHPGMTGKVTVGPAPVRVRIVSVKRGSGSLQVSYRLTKRSAIKAMVYKGGKPVVTKSVKGKSGANSLRIELPKSARRAALKVVLRGGPDGAVQAKMSVRAAGR